MNEKQGEVASAAGLVRDVGASDAAVPRLGGLDCGVNG